MKQQHKSGEAASGVNESRKKVPSHSLFLRFANQARSINLFYIISGASQVLLGATVTLVSILNLVQPIWLAAALSLLGCIVTMLGVYQVYEVINSRRSIRDLARDAIERAINDKN